ncbi:MAG TPA: type II toxin-antitoxin system VapC family toxin [Longimicrobium sp.]|nr:type II toxin-antitoxin system VapC family toxin [Longimicrobium sp.]
MTTYFLDTSAIVRLYVMEPGWLWVRDLMPSAGVLRTAQVCYCDLGLPETISALRQMVQKPDAAKRGFGRSALRQTLPRVRGDLLHGAPLIAVPASGCMQLAADVVERQEIRGADAVHLAAALTARASVAPTLPFVFVSHDVRQCRAAEREGLEVITPS